MTTQSSAIPYPLLSGLETAVRDPSPILRASAALRGGIDPRLAASKYGKIVSRGGAPDVGATTPLFHLSLPETDDAAHFVPLQIALEGLTRINEWQIRRNLRQAIKKMESGYRGTIEIIPPLYASGVYYAEEPPGREDWLDCLAVLRQGFADCEDLAAYRAAELRVHGIAAEAVLKWQWIPRDIMIAQGYPADKLPSRGVWLVHCLVRFPDGSIEDPSKILGMGGDYNQRL